MKTASVWGLGLLLALATLTTVTTGACALAKPEDKEPKRVSSAQCDCSIIVPGGSMKVPNSEENLALAYASLRTGMGIVLATEDRSDEALPILVVAESAAAGAVAEAKIERDGACEKTEIDGREAAICPLKGEVVLLAIVPTPKRYLVAAITLAEGTANMEMGRKLGRKILSTLRSNEPRPNKPGAAAASPGGPVQVDPATLEQGAVPKTPAAQPAN